MKGLVLAATGILILALYLTLRDLASSNRPHELTNSPWVVLLTGANLVVCWILLARLWKLWGGSPSGSSPGRSFGRVAVTLYVVAVSGVNALVFLGAASNLPAVLGGS